MAKCRRKKRYDTFRRLVNNGSFIIQLLVYFIVLFVLALSSPLPVNVTLQSTIQLGASDPSKLREPRTYPSYPGYPSSNGSDHGSSSYPYPYGSQPYDYNQGSHGGYPNYPPSSPNYSPPGYPNQYNYQSQYSQSQPYHNNYPPPSYNYPPPPSGGSHSSSYYPSAVSSSYSSPSSSYTSHGYPSSQFHLPSQSSHTPSSSSSSDDGRKLEKKCVLVCHRVHRVVILILASCNSRQKVAKLFQSVAQLLPILLLAFNDYLLFSVAVFLGGVFDLKDFSKMSNIPIEELLKMGGTGSKSNPIPKRNKEDDSEDEDDISEVTRRRVTHSSAARRKKKKKKRRKPPLIDRGSDDRRSGDREDDYHQEDEEEEAEEEDKINEDSEKLKINNEEAEEDDDDVILKISRERNNNKNRPKGSQSSKSKTKTKNTTTSTTTVAPIQPYPVMPFPYPFPVGVPTTGFGTGQALIAGSAPSLTSPSKLQTEESQLNPTTVKIGKKPSKLDIEEEDDQPVSRPVKENIINVNLPDLFGADGIFDAIDSNRGDMYTNALSGVNNHRRVSISGFTKGIVNRAMKSMVYRIFPSLKNAKRVAAKGCRDVQTIGSMDSILMPLGIAVTLHPLLLPLVPFLLLALGSIKAIESATCFVSEFFK